MEENRRGFLKTLGKLATAVGIGFAVPGLATKANTSTPVKAKIELKPRSDGASKLAAGEYGFDFTGFQTAEIAPLSYETLEKTYKQAVAADERKPNSMIPVDEMAPRFIARMDKFGLTGFKTFYLSDEQV